MSTLADFSADTLAGGHQDLSDYLGNVVLVVNTASHCGFTPQLGELQRLYRAHHDQGFEVLGFPCNQFGGQEPGDAESIGEFCSANYGVTFPMFAKVDVNGADADPLFVWLKSQAKGVLGSERIKWNFTKFLVGRDGAVIRRYGSSTAPSTIEDDVRTALQA